MKRSELEARLRASRLFRGLEPSLVAAAADETVRRVARAGETLWRAGEAATRFTIIQSGLVAIVRSSSASKESMLGLFGPREAIGVAAVLERGGYPAAAVAVTDTVEVLSIHAAALLERMARDASLALAMNRALLEHTEALRSKIDVMSSGPVPRRLAALLDHLVARFGDEDEAGVVRIPVVVSRVQLARVVGARAETVIRTLSRWQKEGWLRTDAGGFVLSAPERLRAVLEKG
jgi:CRP/FNR family transcriptional regulator, nitrogen oxide reductase regulator